MKKYFILSLFLLYNHISFSQIYFEHEQFTDLNNNSIVELYIGFEQNPKQYLDTSIHYILIEINSIHQKNIFNQLYELANNEKSGLINIDQLNFVADGELYNISASGFNSQKKFLYKIDSTSIKISPNESLNSSLSMAYSIKKSDNKGSSFYKNGIEIIPNPTLLFNEEKNKLFFYSEIYNKNLNLTLDSIQIITRIVNTSGTDLFEIRHQKKLEIITIDMGGIDLSFLSAGTYYLKNYISINKQLKLLNQKQFFYAIKASVNSNQIAYTGKFYDKYNEDELNTLFKQLSLIASEKEINLYKNLNSIVDKAKFIERFINLKCEEEGTTDPDLFLKLYIEKIEFATKSYSTRFKEGWKTDRGRVYIKYGKPSDIERNQSGGVSKPYEIWSYNGIEGGIIFVFGDNSENGTYELIHSTKRGEISNNDWQALLQYNTR